MALMDEKTYKILNEDIPKMQAQIKALHARIVELEKVVEFLGRRYVAEREATKQEVKK